MKTQELVRRRMACRLGRHESKLADNVHLAKVVVAVDPPRAAVEEGLRGLDKQVIADVNNNLPRG